MYGRIMEQKLFKTNTLTGTQHCKFLNGEFLARVMSDGLIDSVLRVLEIFLREHLIFFLCVDALHDVPAVIGREREISAVQDLRWSCTSSA